MTRPPMPASRDLGPAFAIAGTAIAVIAVVAGFIIVGGPGHARDERLDELTAQKVGQVVSVAQCALDASGTAPVDYKAATQTRSAPVPGAPPAMCGANNGMQVTVGAGEAPAKPGDITYQQTSPTQIKVCANYHAAQVQNDGRRIYSPFSDIYPTLSEGHAAGVHCYVVDLVKSGRFSAPPVEQLPPLEHFSPEAEVLPQPVP